MVLNIRPLLRGTQKYVTSGATDDDHAVEVSKSNGYCRAPQYDSDADESDTRIWIHVKHSAGNKKYIFSPDTDVYHIGLPLISQTEEIIIQLSKPSDKELNLLHLHTFVDLLNRDPDLAHVPNHNIPATIQALFVCTGCDYVSFFSGIGKTYFFKVFFENAKFSRSFTHIGLDEQANSTLLTFVRLVGCAYFKKHTNAFIMDNVFGEFNMYIEDSDIDSDLNTLSDSDTRSYTPRQIVKNDFNQLRTLQLPFN